MNNSVSYEEKLLENDPFYTEGFNDGLEYSAKWIEEAKFCIASSGDARRGNSP